MPEFVFDSTGMEPPTDFAPIPADQYDVVVTNTELRPTRTGGQQMVVELTVTSGDYANRKLWYRINTACSNPEAVRIGMDQLQRMSLSLGVRSFNATEELHGRECIASVIVTHDPKYGDGNDIKSFRPKTQQVQQAVAQPQAQQAVSRAVEQQTFTPHDHIPF